MNTGRFLGILVSSLFAYQMPVMAQIKLLDDPDIAAYRPRYNAPVFEDKEEKQAINVSKVYVTPKWDVTYKLNRALDSVYRKNKTIKLAEGYRILVYSGTDKNLVNDLKQKVYKLYPNIEVYTIFKQPEYRVSFGDFIDKIQAYDYLKKISVYVPNALIIQDQINIRK